ncbi:MAG TPA: UDP-N-acetylmuramoyl-L-alanyl-D-glutamate--2,6-diaminopimelate ligase [Paracoccaceae bacterium]|nr:UDP-N-acetylmuramoyl-L-alanyl-D-glutamate--2,6-diaminopimelate ligase [Paracoccaceae bacterium]
MAGRTLDALGLTRLGHAGPAPRGDTPVTGIAVDSREVRPGFVFVAIPGHTLDGAEFAQYAVRQGAAAVVVSPAGLEVARRDIGELPVPFFLADEPRVELARLAAAFHVHQPDVMVAVTGTNGKTSVSHFTRQIWAALGYPAASIGTTGVAGAGFEEPLPVTTPEPVALHALLARLAEKGCTHAAMEASSHGLAQHRVDGVRLRAAAFTNITRDHMDYHPTPEDYLAAKMRLFDNVLPPDGVAVLNATDPVSEHAREICVRRGIEVLTVGRGADASLRLTERRFHGEGQEIAFRWRGAEHRSALNLLGEFQAENVLVAAGLALATGGEPEAVFAALPGLEGVRGRMQRAAVRANGAAVYVDYAHTPDALSTAVAALRPHCLGRLIVVFGAGGDRDPGKRPLMGRAVAGLADAAIVTDDNPRSEDPGAIRAAVMQGCPRAEEIGDRAQAILAGVEALREPGDCLLIAGKGHEQGQEVAGEMLPFDDVEQARAAVTVLDGIGQEFGA